MRASLRTPTADPLPYLSERSVVTPSQDGIGHPSAKATSAVAQPLPLPSGKSIAQFNAPLHEVNPDAVRVDPAFATEAEDYRDFCAYRRQENIDGSGARQREAWVRDRAAEVALRHHQWRIDESHYAESDERGARFRVT